ncbi:molybdopterin converting factor small subunit [Desulfosalsimonas propionicica]|uniref:Molybdopterin converting factor small subunit n=1 Tax=Desulfosalsimonas propionicica TaxID=332175 RepID=A0A7W0HLL3_9BACT|nr:MoaD/ThiS family protein [Desulfosalsimonas propionicica]MBA2882437.1 molybdopterin converting factor small subunit [Desulfosalsimonas propionicica]
MNVDFYLYASLARYLPEDARAEKKTIVSVSPGTTARDLLKTFEVPEKEVKLVFVNGVRKNLDAVVSEGDRVGMFPPVGGG